MRRQIAEARRLPVGGGEDREHAGRGLGRRGVDRLDLGVRVRRAQHDAMAMPGKLHVVGIAAAAAHQPRILEARHALTDCKFTHAIQILYLSTLFASGPGQLA